MFLFKDICIVIFIASEKTNKESCYGLQKKDRDC